MAEATLAAQQFPEHDVPYGVSAPPGRVPALDGLSLGPAGLLDIVRERPGANCQLPIYTFKQTGSEDHQTGRLIDPASNQIHRDRHPSSPKKMTPVHSMNTFGMEEDCEEGD